MKRLFVIPRLAAAFLGICLISSCATIPKESPELSQEIGHRLVAMKEAHLNLVHEYFDLKRAKVNKIFEEEWIPKYLEKFFSDERTAKAWMQIVSDDDRDKRLEFLTKLSPRLLDEIKAKRAEYMKPLDKLEDQAVDRLQNEYRQMLAANYTLTSFLASASEVSENRDRYLGMFGIEKSETESLVDQIDQRSEEVIGTIRDANITGG